MDDSCMNVKEIVKTCEGLKGSKDMGSDGGESGKKIRAKQEDG